MNNYTKDEFTKRVILALKDYFGEESDIRVQDVQKNNGINLKGLTILKSGINISPTIYLDSFYSRYRDGEGFGALVYEIINVYEDYSINTSIDMSFFEDYKIVSEHIVFKLINRSKNEELLEKIPHINFLDMAIVFYYMMDSDCIGNGTILIHNNHLEMWNISLDKLINDAKNNTPKLLEYEITNMEDLMRKMMLDKITKELGIGNKEAVEVLKNIIYEGSNICDKISMYILTNSKGTFGASCILYENVLKEFSNKLGSNLIILPSSIHEVIIIPEYEEHDMNHLYELVKEVNTTQVAATEVLSDSVYIYDKSKETIELLV